MRKITRYEVGSRDMVVSEIVFEVLEDNELFYICKLVDKDSAPVCIYKPNVIRREELNRIRYNKTKYFYVLDDEEEIVQANLKEKLLHSLEYQDTILKEHKEHMLTLSKITEAIAKECKAMEKVLEYNRSLIKMLESEKEGIQIE